MKRKVEVLTAMVVALILVGLVANPRDKAYAGPYESGWGRKVTAVSTGALRVTGFALNELSVYNSGTVDAFCLVNTTKATFYTAQTNSSPTTVPIASGMIYTFSAEAHGTIQSFCYMTTNASSTSVLYLGGF